VALGENERYGAEPPRVVYVIIVGFVVLLASGVMAIVALDAQGGGRYGLTAALASLTAAVGAAMVLVGMGMPLDRFSSNLSALILIVGALVVTLGLMALGIVTIAAGVLPWWCGSHRQSHLRCVGTNRGSGLGTGRIRGLPSGGTSVRASLAGAVRGPRGRKP